MSYKVDPKIELWLELFRSTIDTASILLSEVDLGGAHIRSFNQKTIATLLVCRSVNNAFGILVLIEAKLIVEARILSRSVTENLIWLGKIIKDGERFIQEMKMDDVKAKQIQGEFIFENINTNDVITLDKLQSSMRSLKKRYKDPKLLTTKYVAKGTSVEKSYLYYSQLSGDSAHPTISAIRRHITHENSDKYIDVFPEIKEDEIINTLHMTVLMMMGICVAFHDIVGPLSHAFMLNNLAGKIDELIQLG